MNSKLQRNQGFTIIEMLVSLSIFTLVIVAAMGTLLVLVDANAKTQNAQLIMTNLTFGLDSMSREIRTGENWYCGDDPGGASWPSIPSDTNTSDCGKGEYISIFEASGRLTSGDSSSRITYFYDSDSERLYRRIGRDGTNANWLALTSDIVDITTMYFVVTGTDPRSDPDYDQPKVTIVVEGEIGNSAVPERYKDFKLQTTITQNTID